MEIQKTILSILAFLLLSSVFYSVKQNQELKQRDLIIQNLRSENIKLQNNVSLLKTEIIRVKSVLQNLSKTKELRNPNWEELKVFLEVDKTNELVYNDNFDCSGFAIELFKRARAKGLICAFVEIEFEEEKAHTLNAFQTDKGLIFVDVTGDESGNGKDKIAYVELGKPYGTIALEGVKERKIACNITCSQLAKSPKYTNHSNLFDYEYFLNFKECIRLYESCVDQYNQAVENYNKGIRTYSRAELEQWLENLKELESELGKERVYFLSESNTVKNVQIYW